MWNPRGDPAPFERLTVQRHRPRSVIGGALQLEFNKVAIDDRRDVTDLRFKD